MSSDSTVPFKYVIEPLLVMRCNPRATASGATVPTKPPTSDAAAQTLAHRAFPELAAALRSQCDAILQSWAVLVREALPHVRPLPFDELIDNLPRILPRIADA